MTQLYAYVDPLSLPKFETFNAVIEGTLPVGVWLEPPGVERTESRYPPEFVDDPGATGLFKDLAGGTYNFPPNFVVASCDSTLVGYRTILSGNNFFVDRNFGHYVDEFLDRLGSEHPFYNEDTRLRRQDTSNLFSLETAERYTRRISGTAVALTSTEPSNYGSFLFRVLPKIAILRDYGLMDLPVIVYANHRSFIELLNLAGLKEDKIIRHDTNQITQIERLIVPSLRNPHAFLDETSRKFFQVIIEKFGRQTIAGRKLYISRLSHALSGGNGRVMLNEQELIQRLSDSGVEIYEPEKYTSKEQVEAFSSAEMIIGPSGSGMFNTVFCRGGTKIIDIESEPDWIYAHTGLFASKQLRYGIFVGESDPTDTRVPHRRWSVNIEALLNRISAFR